MQKNRRSLLTALLTCVCLFAFVGSAMAFPPVEGQSEIIATYTFGLHTPESVATDADGNVYVSMVFLGQIVKVDPETGESEVYASFGEELAKCPQGALAGVAGIWINPLTRTMYANVNTCDPATNGVWKIPPDGAPELLGTVPMGVWLNGIVKRGDMLYSPDSFSFTGAVYATSIFGDGSPAGILIEDPLIAFDPTIPPPPGIPIMPGANGIQKYGGDLYISHSGKNMIIRVPLSGYGEQIQVGTPEQYVDADGVDDFAFDLLGNIYYTSNPYNKLVKVTPDNVATVLVTADDGINGATAAAFGRLGDRKVLYVTSGAMPFMPPPYNNGQDPSLIAYGNDIGGWPFR